MRYGPFIFLGLLCALSLSWLGMVATPQIQIGNQQPTNVPPANVIYPTPYPGLAQLGREVYRANGCAYCHTQVVRQDHPKVEVVITNPGTNEAAVVQAVAKLRGGTSSAQARELLASLPATIVTLFNKAAADLAERELSVAGAEVTIRVVPTGPDIARGWGNRLTVGADYLYDAPVLLGTTRLGPDLTNVGLRRPDPEWHLVHLYDPKLKVPESIMPKYPFLFQKRPRGARPSPGALPIQADQEIIPSVEAYALVAYLLNLRADLPLFEAPAPALPGATTAGDTNAPAGPGQGTNAPAGASTNSQAPSQGVVQ